MINKKIFSVILLISNLANIECHGSEYKTLSSLIDKKIYNTDSNTVSNNIDTLFNNNSTIYDINNYINDDFTNKNPLPLFIRGELNESERQYYLDRINEIMNGKYMKHYKSEDDNLFEEFTKEYNYAYNNKYNHEYNAPLDINDCINYDFINENPNKNPIKINENDSNTESIIEYNNGYTPPLVLDPDDKYTERGAQRFIDDMIKHGKVLDKEILEDVAIRFGKSNVMRFIDEYLSHSFYIFDKLSREEDVLDYYDLLNYNLVAIPLDELSFFYKIWYKTEILNSNNIIFERRKYGKNRNIIIMPSINVLQKPISNILKGNNNTNLEKLIYNTNKTRNNTFILDSITNSVISVIKDNTFINDESNKQKLLNNFSTYTKYISTADKMYIENRLQILLSNSKSSDYDATQYNNLKLLVDTLKTQISNTPIELQDKNDLILNIRFNFKNLYNIVKYSFDNNINTDIRNKNMKIIIDTLNDENIDRHTKYNLLLHIIDAVNSNISNNDKEVVFELFKINFLYLLEEENFYVLLCVIRDLSNESNYHIGSTMTLQNIQNCILDCFIKKMFETEIYGIGTIKFSENTSEKYVEQRTYVVNKVLYQILGPKFSTDLLFNSLNKSPNEIHNKEFASGIINFALQNKIFKDTSDESKQCAKNLTANLKKLNNNIKNIFGNIINAYLNDASIKQDKDKKYILKKILKLINNNGNQNNINNNVNIENQNNINNNPNTINENNNINIENQNNINDNPNTMNENNNINIENQNSTNNNIENEININAINQNNINEQNITDDLSNIIDQDMKDCININEDISNDPRLKFSDTLNLSIDNNIKTASNLTNFLNNNNNKQHVKTISNSMINFVTQNKAIDDKNFINNFILNLGNTPLKSFRKLVEEKTQSTDKNTELYKTYKNLLTQCDCYIEMNERDNDSIEKLKKKRKRTTTKAKETKQEKQSNINKKQIKQNSMKSNTHKKKK